MRTVTNKKILLKEYNLSHMDILKVGHHGNNFN